MSTDTTFQINSFSFEDTFALGERLGRNCRGGEVLLLSADLGGGKTTLTKGIAKGLAISQTVTSPSFTISRVYDGRDQLTLHHFDFYRLQDPGILAHEISEVVKNNKAVAVIEWGESVKKILPKATTRITIERTDTGEDSRLITVTLPATHRYLLEGQV